jgi:phosphopentomutase
MKFFSKLISQLLIVSMIVLPFSTQAGMIGTDQVVTNATAQANLDKVRDFVSRTDVQNQFEALGLTAANAQERVNAMTQEEINRIAGKIDSLPAGADSSTGWWIAGVIIVGLIIWYFWK